MLLSDRDIRAELDSGRVVLDPYEPAMIQPSSIDVHLDKFFRLFDNHKYPVIDPAQDQPDLTRLVEVDGDEAFMLHPGEFVLGSTLEAVTLPDDVAARLEGKSSLGRLGLLTHSTAGFIDPGFTGHVTLELSNVATLPITLWPGMKIGQLCLLPAVLAVGAPVRLGAIRLALPGPARPDAVALVARASTAPASDQADRAALSGPSVRADRRALLVLTPPRLTPDDPRLAGRHLLTLPAGVGAEDVEVLASRSRFAGARWETPVPTTPARGRAARDPLADVGVLRLSRHSDLVGPFTVADDDAERLGLPPGTATGFVVRAPRERGEPPYPGGDRDGLKRAFPTAMPVRDEERVLHWLVDAARRLGGAVRLADADGAAVLVPDPQAVVDLTVWSAVRLEPAAALAVVRRASPAARLAMEATPWQDPGVDPHGDAPLTGLGERVRRRLHDRAAAADAAALAAPDSSPGTASRPTSARTGWWSWRSAATTSSRSSCAGWPGPSGARPPTACAGSRRTWRTWSARSPPRATGRPGAAPGRWSGRPPARCRPSSAGRSPTRPSSSSTPPISDRPSRASSRSRSPQPEPAAGAGARGRSRSPRPERSPQPERTAGSRPRAPGAGTVAWYPDGTTVTHRLDGFSPRRVPAPAYVDNITRSVPWGPAPGVAPACPSPACPSPTRPRPDGADVLSLLAAHLLMALAAPALVAVAGSPGVPRAGPRAGAAAVWALTQTSAVFGGGVTRSRHSPWAAGTIGMKLAFRLDAPLVAHDAHRRRRRLARAALLRGVLLAGRHATSAGSRGASSRSPARCSGWSSADDLLLLFVFWELTTVFSYLLIGHYSTARRAAAPRCRRSSSPRSAVSRCSSAW